MSKAIFFIRPMHGHVNPTLGLVKELVQRGEEVIYYTTETFREKIQTTGAECRLYADSASRLNMGMEPILPPGDNRNPVNNFEKQIENILGDLATRMEDVKSQQQDLYEEIKVQKPDYIIYDYIDAFWGKMLAKKMHVPAVASIPSFAICKKLAEQDPISCIKYIFHMSPHEPPFKDHSIDLKDLIDFISDRTGSTYKIKNFNMLDYGNSEFLNIVYTSRYFHPYEQLFDDTFKFIGCSFDLREETVDFPYHRLSEKSLIFISLGSILDNVDFYKTCFEAFKDTDKQVILSIGSQVDLAELGDIPGNVTVCGFVPQLEILKHSDLFITHGGLNSVKEGIYHIVPLIVLPQHGDAFAVAHLVHQLEAGIGFEHSNISPEELRKTAEKVCANDRFRQNCKKIKATFEQAGGAKRAVDEIFKLKERLTIR